MNNWDLGVNDFQAKDGKSQVGWLVDLVESISLEQLCAAGGYPRIQPEIFGHLRPVLWFLLLFTWGCRRCSSKFPSCCFKFCMDQNRIFHCVPRKLDGLPLSRAQIIQICGHRKFKVSGISGDELPEKLNTSSRRKSKFAILLIGSHSCFWNLLTSLFPFPKTCLKHIETLKTPTNYCMPPGKEHKHVHHQQLSDMKTPHAGIVAVGQHPACRREQCRLGRRCFGQDWSQTSAAQHGIHSNHWWDTRFFQNMARETHSKNLLILPFKPYF